MTDTKQKVDPASNGQILLISGNETLVLDACKGSDTITPNNKGPFDWVDGDFVDWNAHEPGQDTPETEVGVYEMTANGKYESIFGSFGPPLDDLCFTTSQVKNFCKKFRQWLRTDGYGTFFLFKSHGKFFVANVSFNSGGLGVGVYHLSYGSVWLASFAHRIVVPATKHLGTQS